MVRPSLSERETGEERGARSLACARFRGGRPRPPSRRARPFPLLSSPTADALSAWRALAKNPSASRPCQPARAAPRSVTPRGRKKEKNNAAPSLHPPTLLSSSPHLKAMTQQTGVLAATTTEEKGANARLVSERKGRKKSKRREGGGGGARKTDLLLRCFFSHDAPPLSLPRPSQLAFTGAIAVADLVKTTLGPKGMVRRLRKKRERATHALVSPPRTRLSPQPSPHSLSLSPPLFLSRTKSCSPSPAAGA